MIAISDEVLEQLCDIVKMKCRISWDDEGTNKHVEDIARNAVDALYHKLGINGDYDASIFLEAGINRTLFEQCALYDWNNELETFEENYKRELLTARHQWEVADYEDD